MLTLNHSFKGALATAALAAGLLGIAGAAHARSDVAWSIGLSVPGVSLGAAAPVYAPPAYYAAPVYAPPVYVAPPRPMYYAPAPVYYRPPVYYAPPRHYYPGAYYRQHGHGWGHHR
ncbi:hypothetical protein PY257_08895 [Ramlibacter sp. H39-3-26]|uniref:hypothetical protein n=1 Tax=Curvibacter soli TaxID=3031331 RepID=UPI0023DA1467|nr:hypothetical protein [Ramlibacter sp. H39-3-26]MDF1485292.1 hypothetical protein [Ramlibacter sp. H39-3-26]